MRVLHLVDEPWDSGLTQYALAVARGLHAAGHIVGVAALPQGPACQQAERWGLPTVPLRGWRDLPRLRRWIQTHAIEVLNPHTGRAHSLAACAHGGRQGGVQRGNHGRCVLIRTRADARPVRWRLGHRWLCRRTDRVITAAEFIRQQYLQLARASDQRSTAPTHPLGREGRCPPEWVTTIYQGVAPSDYPSRPFPPRDELKVGLVARLDPVKGHRIALQAFQEVHRVFPQSRFVIAGPGANWTVETLKGWIREWRLDHVVDLAGYLPEVRSLMGACHVGVIASVGSEAVSRVALEWMAMGRPLVATRVGCLPELVVEGETGWLVPPGDVRAMADRIIQLLRDGGLSDRMGQAARHRVKTHFSVQRWVQLTEAVYAEALAHSPS